MLYIMIRLFTYTNKSNGIMKEEPILLNIARIQSDSVVADLNLFLPKLFFFMFLVRLFVKDNNLTHFSEVWALVSWTTDCYDVNLRVFIQRT